MSGGNSVDYEFDDMAQHSDTAGPGPSRKDPGERRELRRMFLDSMARLSKMPQRTRRDQRPLFDRMMQRGRKSSKVDRG